jgi:hypothetical protein
MPKEYYYIILSALGVKVTCNVHYRTAKLHSNDWEPVMAKSVYSDTVSFTLHKHTAGVDM